MFQPECNAGYEPRRLFNVVQFLMNDRDCKGTVSLEETMQIMYLRYGRQLLDAQLEEIFGTSDLNSGRTLTLSQFLHSLHLSQIRQLNSQRAARKYKPPPPVLKRKRSSASRL
jgi:calmodulin